MARAKRMCLRGRSAIGGLALVAILAVLASGTPGAAERPADANPRGGDQQASSSQARRRSAAFIKSNDRNGDGKLSRDELPERARRLFDRIDRDKDGFVTLEEHMAFRRAQAERRGRPGRRRPPLPKPDHADVRYGPHRRNVLDVWLAKRDKPTPLVIFYHGGGFRGGDKRGLSRVLLSRLRARGVTVAAANYRLSGTAPFPAQMHDSARALQFLRQHAARYNIDGSRVGATGGSAGAGISLWLAFHDDLARPDSKDPLARQSTRLTAAVVYAAQSSYDPRFIRKLFDTDKVEGALIPFFGMKSAVDVDDPKFHPLFEEASAINHLTKDDAPVMLYYPQPNMPLPKNSTGGRHIHHPKFGIVLKQKMDKLGIECVLKLREDYRGATPPRRPTDDYVGFFCKHLGVAAPASSPAGGDPRPPTDR